MKACLQSLSKSGQVTRHTQENRSTFLRLKEICCGRRSRTLIFEFKSEMFAGYTIRKTLSSAWLIRLGLFWKRSPKPIEILFEGVKSGWKFSCIGRLLVE